MPQLSAADQKRTLTDFLAGLLNADELQERLRDHLAISAIEGGLSINIHHPIQVQVPVRPSALGPMLERYLRWEANDDELARWATLIQMLDPYSNPPGLTDEEADELMEPVWEVLADLAAPELLAMPLRDRVELALPALAAAEHRLSARAV